MPGLVQTNIKAPTPTRPSTMRKKVLNAGQTRLISLEEVEDSPRIRERRRRTLRVIPWKTKEAAKSRKEILNPARRTRKQRRRVRHVWLIPRTTC